MWTICKTCGAVVADAALHATTHQTPRRKITRPTTPRPHLRSAHGN